MEMLGTSMARATGAVSVLAVVMAGCSGEETNTSPAASPAPASPSASAPAMAAEGGDFLTAVHNAGLPIDSDDYAIAMAQGVCDMIKEQLPADAPQELVRNSEPDFTEDQVTFFIKTAEQRYCPTMG